MNERLQESRERVGQLERSNRRLKELRAQGKRMRARVRELAERLERERKDVDRLEELSVQSVWHSLCGDKPETLAKEKLQALEAQAKHDEAAALLREIRAQRQSMEDAVEALENAPAEHERLLAEAEEALKHSGTAAGERLCAIAEEVASLRDDLLQLDEARSAAQCSIVALARVEGLLGSARNWGGLDMLGGGLLTTAIKHDRINSARAALATAQAHLRNLECELQDVGRIGNISIDIGSFATFADYVFDGLIIDWFVQSRIREAQDQVSATIAEVQRIDAGLGREEKHADEELDDLESERRSLVEGEDAGTDGLPRT